MFLLVYFTCYTILGSYPFGNYMTNNDIEVQLIATLVFEFVFIIISKLFSLKLKIDLSYKGREILSFVPKSVIFSAVIIALVLIIYSLAVGINAKFIIVIILMSFSILLEFGITRMFKC